MHDDGIFAEDVAAQYDEVYAAQADPAVVDPIVAFLADLAGTGRALELGIGTGRIALLARPPGGADPRHRAVACDGRPAPGEAG